MAAVLSAWDPDLSVLIGCAGLLLAYWTAHREDYARAGWFIAGVAVLLFALISPLDTLGDQYLFSAHMAQHLLLVLIAPPLMLRGLSPRFAQAVVASPLGRPARILSKPAAAWMIGIGVLALWHAPYLFDAALASEPLHIVEHLSFLVSATIFWWPLITPLPRYRMPPLLAELYLLGGALASALLGIWLAFANPLYTAYQHPADTLHLEGLLRGVWGLTPALDQQAGGLLMWVGGGFIFLAAMLLTFAQWSDEPAQEIPHERRSSESLRVSSSTPRDYSQRRSQTRLLAARGRRASLEDSLRSG